MRKVSIDAGRITEIDNDCSLSSLFETTFLIPDYPSVGGNSRQRRVQRRALARQKALASLVDRAAYLLAGARSTRFAGQTAGLSVESSNFAL